MSCCKDCEGSANTCAGDTACASTCSPEPRPVKPPLVFDEAPGYLHVARRETIQVLTAVGGLGDVSAAIPLGRSHSLTAEVVVYRLTAGIQFILGVDGSNDRESWKKSLTRVAVTSPGFQALTLQTTAFQFFRLSYSTNLAGVVSFASGVWRWQN